MGIDGPYIRMVCDACNTSQEECVDPLGELGDKGIGDDNVRRAVEQARWGWYEDRKQSLLLCPSCLEQKETIVEHDLNSKLLRRLSYNKENEVLKLEFRDGSIYQYDAVPWTVIEGLIEASSGARYFNRVIRGKYRELPSDWENDVPRRPGR